MDRVVSRRRPSSQRERDLVTLSDEEWCERYQPSGGGIAAALILGGITYIAVVLLVIVWRAGLL